jgi:hypothetical protein
LSSSRHCCDDQTMVSHSVCVRKKKKKTLTATFFIPTHACSPVARATELRPRARGNAVHPVEPSVQKLQRNQKRATNPTLICHHRVSVGQDSPCVCFSRVMTTLPSESDQEHPSGTTLPNKVNEMGTPPSTATSNFDTANLTFTALLFVPGGAGTDTSTCKRAWLKTWRVCVRACACACGVRACAKRVQILQRRVALTQNTHLKERTSAKTIQGHTTHAALMTRSTPTW